VFNQKQIKNVIFPLGKMYKKDVKKLTKKLNYQFEIAKIPQEFVLFGKEIFLIFYKNISRINLLR